MLRRVILLVLAIVYGIILYVTEPPLLLSCFVGAIIGVFFDDAMDKLGVPNYDKW